MKNESILLTGKLAETTQKILELNQEIETNRILYVR